MDQIARISAADYAELLHGGECFESAEYTPYSINYEVSGKQIIGGFDSKLSAFMQAQTVARMLNVKVIVKHDGKMIQRFYGQAE